MNISDATASYKLTVNTSTDAQLFIRESSGGYPDWTAFFDGFFSRDTFGKTKSTGAVLVMTVRERFFALTFGTGHFLLSSDGWEERFGLRVALNCIPEDMVRSIDKHSLDQLLRHSREQASREATPTEFGFDVEQDLLRAVTGRPRNKEYGTRITGSDSLHLALPLHLNQLPELLDKLYDEFRSIAYRSKFPWVDQIAEVTDSALQQQLENRLVSVIASGQTSRIWMAVPELISWNKVAGFRLPSRGKTPQYSDIHLAHFLGVHGGEQAVTADLLHTRAVRCIDQDGGTLHEWKAFQCLYAEVELGRDLFVLSNSNWYKVKSDFVDETNAAFDAVPEYEATLPEFMDESEGAYLKRLVESHAGQFVLMDQRLIPYGGGNSKIEFCDLMSNDNDLIHVKRYGQSSALSHLFAQGTVSGELFQMDAAFRDKINDRLPAGRKIQDPQQRPKQSKYRVVFMIVSDRSGPLALPFFSRLNLKNAVRRLEAYGFRVAKGKIIVNEVFAKTAKVNSKKKKK